MITIKRLKTYTIIGILFVLAAGTICHFVYEWSGKNFFAGLIFPVNESVWEHMKLVFFPMLLYALIMGKKLSSEFPSINAALAGGTLTGTLAVPVIFYTYTGIIGRDIFIMDFLTFAVSILIAFYVIYKSTLSGALQNYSMLLYLLTGIFFACFLLFSVAPLPIELFKEPAKTA